jgi:hypothetical protein
MLVSTDVPKSKRLLMVVSLLKTGPKTYEKTYHETTGCKDEGEE